MLADPCSRGVLSLRSCTSTASITNRPFSCDLRGAYTEHSSSPSHHGVLARKPDDFAVSPQSHRRRCSLHRHHSRAPVHERKILHIVSEALQEPRLDLSNIERRAKLPYPPLPASLPSGYFQWECYAFHSRMTARPISSPARFRRRPARPDHAIERVEVSSRKRCSTSTSIIFAPRKHPSDYRRRPAFLQVYVQSRMRPCEPPAHSSIDAYPSSRACTSSLRSWSPNITTVLPNSTFCVACNQRAGLLFLSVVVEDHQHQHLTSRYHLYL